jgi:hypothetical protein
MNSLRRDGVNKTVETKAAATGAIALTVGLFKVCTFIL